MEFAKALGGEDASQETIDMLWNATKKGFEAVAKIFGGMNNLPDISQKTYEAVKKAFEEWKGAPVEDNKKVDDGEETKGKEDITDCKRRRRRPILCLRPRQDDKPRRYRWHKDDRRARETKPQSEYAKRYGRDSGKKPVSNSNRVKIRGYDGAAKSYSHHTGRQERAFRK